MAKYDNRRIIHFFLGLVIGLLIAYAIVATPGYQQHILRFEAGVLLSLLLLLLLLLLVSHDVASGSEITPCIKIDKALVVYSFTGNVMTSITTLCT